MRDVPHILLINPWIHDFAAYDFWAKPYGLLTLAAILRKQGAVVSYIDCLDRFHPEAPEADPLLRHGRGPYLKTRIPKPPGLGDIPRNYSRYGIKPEWFAKDLASAPEPDVILMTSLMTYWYPGTFETIRFVRQFYPNTPVVLGGIYATLCEDHARRHSPADIVAPGAGEETIADIIKTVTGFSSAADSDSHDINTCPYPAHDLQRVIAYVPIMTSRGCPFACSYCASHFLTPGYVQRSPENVVEEIMYWHHVRGVKNFVFYDDALLVNAQTHAIPIFEQIIRSGISVFFHTPNAVHIREITETTADLMYKAGFKHVRLGLETTSFDTRKNLDHKVTADQFHNAVRHLKSAGFGKDQVGAYLLSGLPGQTPESLELSFRTVTDSGITPIPAYYSPIPHTALWKQAAASSRYPLESDPVFSNNAIMPCSPDSFSWDVITRLKHLSAAMQGHFSDCGG